MTRCAWRLTDEGLVNAPPGCEAPVEWVDLGDAPGFEQESVLVRKAAELQASLDLRTGPLIRVAYFDLGAGQAARLLIVIHHLAVDGVSWRILLEDFQRAYQGSPLPAKTTSYREWAQRLTDLAQTDGVRRELGFWLDVQTGAAAALPADRAAARTLRLR